METAPHVKARPRSLWIFGPVGAGKSSVLARLPLAGFELVSTDSLLEAELHRLRWPTDVAAYDEQRMADFRELRARVIRPVWDRVPAWRAVRRDLAFETTGNKPDLFRRELEMERTLRYDTFGCALAVPLAECLARNSARARVLPTTLVKSTVADFECSWTNGTYRQMFGPARLVLCRSIEEAAVSVGTWLRSPRRTD